MCARKKRLQKTQQGTEKVTMSKAFKMKRKEF